MATLHKPPAEVFKGSWRASDSASSVAQHAKVDIEVVHEIGRDFIGSTVREEHLVAPSDEPTLVTVASHVVTDAARRMSSPEYLASVRRRKSSKMKNMVASLAKKARRDDFEAFVFKVVEEIRELIVQLTDVQREGNTREILRQIRDTFLDGGHERYREAKARDIIASILERLSQADEVTPEDVDQVWDELYDNGLSGQFPSLFLVDADGVRADG